MQCGFPAAEMVSSLSALLKEQQCVPVHRENVGASAAFDVLLKQI